jgi:hypothetical protein
MFLRCVLSVVAYKHTDFKGVTSLMWEVVFTTRQVFIELDLLYALSCR